MQKNKNASQISDFLKLRRTEQSQPDTASTQPEPEPEQPPVKDVAAEEVSQAREDETGAVIRTRTRPALGLAQRGKGLTLKYDVAMLVLLALAGLVVIAFLWGYHAGRSAPRTERQEPSAPLPGNKGDAPGGGPEAASPYYNLQLMSDPHYDEQRKARYESIAEGLREEGCDAEVVTEDARIFLFAGRFEDKDSPEAKRLMLRLKRDYADCFWVQRQ
ncbi:MAG: hypothetical protein ABIH04_09790 [Planctomycetota bacterium]